MNAQTQIYYISESSFIGEENEETGQTPSGTNGELHEPWRAIFTGWPVRKMLRGDSYRESWQSAGEKLIFIIFRLSQRQTKYFQVALT